MNEGTCYYPIPPRVWSRVQNYCSTNKAINDANNNLVPSYLPNGVKSLLQAEDGMQMLLKGNILQYKKNSADLTKKQKFSQIAKGNSSRKKCYASQSTTVTSPNTSGFMRANSVEIPFPNNIAGSPNNIAGPYEVLTPNPFDCPSDNLIDGGTLLCNVVVDPCTGTVLKRNVAPNSCYSSSYSDVPGKQIELCWISGLQTWYPRQRLTMNNGLDKWPVNYKGFVSALRPKPNPTM